VRTIPEPLRAPLNAFRDALTAQFADRLLAVKLFGSYARGDAHPESDVDVFVVIDGATWHDQRIVLDLAADLSLESDLWISPTLLDRERYERDLRQERPLVMAVEREGVPL
jgi:predicted nucleotidyltransferase